ncbi:MAG TPA: phosphoribosyltransferase family protein [Candidatus Saccharimonadales bacterium]|nr:phosphoribosyltransferase family protein [Candidatus Saccharimonadales bacterium]
MSVLEKIISIIAPHECVSCQKEGLLLCIACQNTLPAQVAACYKCGRTSHGSRTCVSCRPSTPLYRVDALTAYEGLAKELVYGLKFERKQAASVVLGLMIAERVAGGRFSYVTHVPTATRRIRMRGYDQAQCIARQVSIQLSIPYAPLLSRTGQQRQVGQHRTIRLQQMRQAFRPTNHAAITNAHILLIDDVLTTGASLESAARALKAAGARRVSGAVFAVAGAR